MLCRNHIVRIRSTPFRSVDFRVIGSASALIFQPLVRESTCGNRKVSKLSKSYPKTHITCAYAWGKNDSIGCMKEERCGMAIIVNSETSEPTLHLPPSGGMGSLFGQVLKQILFSL
jgi:hypothetical protein